MRTKVIDDDNGEVRVEVYGLPVRSWSYMYSNEHRSKMLAAHEFAEGWFQAMQRMKEYLNLALNNHLVEMEEGYDDSITGYNEACDIVRKAFMETIEEA